MFSLDVGLYDSVLIASTSGLSLRSVLGMRPKPELCARGGNRTAFSAATRAHARISRAIHGSLASRGAAPRFPSETTRTFYSERLHQRRAINVQAHCVPSTRPRGSLRKGFRNTVVMRSLQLVPTQNGPHASLCNGDLVCQISA